MEETYKIKIESFEGPLDLLLELVEKRKLFISDVSLAQVADDYISHVQEIEEFPVEQSAHFILIASTLLLIKSKSLLPALDLTRDEQESMADLEARLKEYKHIKELSLHVRELFGITSLFTQNTAVTHEPVFSPSKEITRETILSSIRRIIQEFPVEKILPKVIVKKIISLEEAIGSLTERIKIGLKISFNDFTKGNSNDTKEYKDVKVNIIVSFLAMLELVKRGGLHVRQDSQFGNIELETGEISVPHYE